MSLNDIKFEKTTGGLGRPAANDDVISGLIMSLNGKILAIPAAMELIANNALGVAKIKYIEQLASLGIVETPAGETALTDAQYAHNAIVYHVNEFFKMSPKGTLYLCVKTTGEVSKDDIKALQQHAVGTIRQIGIFTPTMANLAVYQTASAELENEHQPVSVLVGCGKGTLTLAILAAAQDPAIVVAGRCNVSVLVSCDLDAGVVAKLGEDHFAYNSCIGNLLGAVSNAAVNECIAWVSKFPCGLVKPGFITGEFLTDVTTTNLNLINDNKFIFVRTHVGDAGNYYNDSFTLDLATSDYAFIENVRTIDKATRGIRSKMIPFLNAPIYVDAQSGKLRADMISYLESLASEALVEMEKAGELSGYQASIDPDQDILTSSQLQVVIKNVPVGVMRVVNIKIGLTTKLT